MSNTWKDKKRYFQKELIFCSECTGHEEYCWSVPSVYKRMERKRRRNKIKQAMRDGNYDSLPKFKREDEYNYF